MGPLTVPKYEKTTDPRRMMVHAVLNEAIRTDWENVKAFLPARVATSIEYEAGSKRANAWNEGGKKVSINLPLKDGWYVPDGNPFAIPNGNASNRDNPDALYLYRRQDSRFSGPPGRGGDFYYVGRRVVNASDDWSGDSGVALVGGREATAPLVAVPAEKLAEVTDPKILVQRAELLDSMARDFGQRFGDNCTAEMRQRFVIEPLETAKMLREVAGKIEAALG